MAREESATATGTPEATPAMEEPTKATGRCVSELHAGDTQMSLSMIGSANVGELDATASAIGVATAGGDANVTASWVPFIRAKGGANVQQSYASAVIAGGDTTVHQAGAPIIVGKTIDITQGGGALLVAGDATVKNGMVGLILSTKTEVSEDSKVLVDTKAAVIIALALLGGFGLLAVAVVFGMKQFMSKRHYAGLKHRLHHLAKMEHRLQERMPSMADVTERIRQLRHAG